MGSIALQPAIEELLERAGARPRGNRHDCPKCGAQRTITHTPECFFCHHCGWKGNARSLERELGIRREWLPKAEYIRQQKARQQAEGAAKAFLSQCRTERLRAFDALRELSRLEALAHDAGPESETAWNALALVYSQRPRLEATAALLCDGSIQDRRRWLEADAAERERIAGEIVLAGGMRDDAWKFVEVEA